MLLHDIAAASMEQSMPENLSTQVCEVKAPAPTERSDRGVPAEDFAPDPTLAQPARRPRHHKHHQSKAELQR